MKKISSKIIVSLVLAIFLWTGVGTFGIHTANAGWLSIGKVGADVVMGINGAILQLIAIPLTSYLLSIAAAMLDMAVNFTLSTDIFRNSEFGVTTVWALVRDICNITFIFILLWTALQTIVGVAGVKTKEMISHVVIAALLINFSLFLTRILIDFGNIFAVSLYNQILSVNPANTGGIDVVIMDKLGMAHLLDASKNALAAAGGGIKNVFSVEYGMISYLQLGTTLAAFVVFVYAMLLMAARSVILIFLAAISPIGFMGDVLPKLKEYSSMWRETLYGQVMIAPIFLLFVYLIVRVGDVFNTTSFSGGASLVTADSVKYLAYFKYIMIIFLLVIAVKTTKKMTGAIGAAVEKFGIMAVGAAVGVASGGAALALRQSAGRIAANQLEGEKGADLRARANQGDKGARLKLAALEKTANSSFDARNAKIAGVNVAGAASKAYGMAGSSLGVSVMKTGKAGGIASQVAGLDKTVATSRTEQEKKEKEEYNRIQASVTNKEKLAARPAINLRDDAVKAELDGEGVIDPETGKKVFFDPKTGYHIGGNNTEYNELRNQRIDYLRVKDTDKDLVIEQSAVEAATGRIDELKNKKAEFEKEGVELEKKKIALETEGAKIKATGTKEEKDQYEKDLAQNQKDLAEHQRDLAQHQRDQTEANKTLNAAEREKAKKKKEIQEELKVKNAAEIAALDEQMKVIKTGIEREVENSDRKVKAKTGRKIMGADGIEVDEIKERMLNDDEKAKLRVVNQARNYAASIRSGRIGHVGGISAIAGKLSGGRLDIVEERRERVADNMESK